MAVSASALTTLDNLQYALQISTSDTTYDTILESCIDRATEAIERETERLLKARNYNGFNASSGVDFEHKTSSTGDTVPSEDYIRFDGDRAVENGTVFYLPQFPILRVSSTNRNRIQHPNAVTFTLEELSERGSTVSGNETWDALTEFDDFILDQETGAIRLLGGCFSSGKRNYRVKCTAGYSYGTANTQPYIPRDLEQLCIAVARKMFRNEYGLTSEQIGTWSRSYKPEEQNAFIDETTARYRRYSI